MSNPGASRIEGKLRASGSMRVSDEPALARDWFRTLLWATALGPVLAIGLFVVFKWLREHGDWPTAESDNLLLAGVFAMAVLPIMTVLIGAVIAERGVFKTKWFEVNLSVSRSETVLGIEVPPNIGASAEPIGDSGSLAILNGLERASAHPVAVLDLEDGKAWWETRLFILAAGAERLGRPEVLIFITGSPNPRSYIGWARPAAVTAAFMRVGRRESDLYRASHGRATAAATAWTRTAATVPPGAAMPIPPEADQLGHPWNQLFIAAPNGRLNPFAAEQFLAADLGASLEVSTPHGVTREALIELLGSDLISRSITEEAASSALLTAFIDTSDPWIVVTDGDSLRRVLPREVLQDAVLRAIARTFRERTR
jgi:hypothetical protein